MHTLTKVEPVGWEVTEKGDANTTVNTLETMSTHRSNPAIQYTFILQQQQQQKSGQCTPPFFSQLYDLRQVPKPRSCQWHL